MHLLPGDDAWYKVSLSYKASDKGCRWLVVYILRRPHLLQLSIANNGNLIRHT